MLTMSTRLFSSWISRLSGGAILAGFRYAKANREIQNYASQVQERTTTESVIEGFYSVLLNERLQQILKNTYDVDKEILEIGKRYYRIGRAMKLDVLQLETQTAQLVPAIAQAKNQIEISAASLATLLRDLDATQIRVQGQLVAPDPKWVHEMLAKKMPSYPKSRKLASPSTNPKIIRRFSWRSIRRNSMSSGRWDALPKTGRPISAGRGDQLDDRPAAERTDFRRSRVRFSTEFPGVSDETTRIHGDQDRGHRVSEPDSDGKKHEHGSDLA